MADKAFFISDLHLGSSTEPNAFVLLRFLKSFESVEQITHLFLVGDIFDLWISDHFYFRKKFSPIVSELVRLKSLGVRIHYFEGNHDLYLDRYFGKELGFTVHTRAAYFEIAGLQIRVEHGDQMDRSDYQYLRLRRFLRSAPLKWLAPRLPGHLLAHVGEKASHASRRSSSLVRLDSSDRIRRVIREHVQRAWLQKPFELFIAGHVHIVDDTEVRIVTGTSHRTTRAVNLGSWYEKPMVFSLNIDGGAFQELL